MIGRVTNQTMAHAAIKNLQTGKAALAEKQEQAATLAAITKPSDDPTGTGDSMRIRAAQRAENQYNRNITDGTNWLNTAETALSASSSIISRVRDLTVQGANGTMSATAKEAIARELEGLKQDLLSQANTSYLGRSVFAGTSDAGVAFRADYSFTGVPDSSVERRVGTNQTVRVDIDGASAFGSGASSVFALIDDIATDLRSGVNVGSRLAAVDSRLTTLLGHQTQVGASQNTITRAEETSMKKMGTLEAQRSSVEDLDLATVILDLQVQEVNYKSALAVTARVLQPTLMDFLR